MENSNSNSSKTPNVPAAPWTTEGKLLVGGFILVVIIIIGVVLYFVIGGGGGGKNVLKGYIDISSLQLTQDAFKDAWLNNKDIKIKEIQLYPDYKYLAYANTTPTHLWVGKEPPPADNRLTITLNGVTEYVADDHHFVDVSQYGECFSTGLNALTFKKNGSECVADKCLSSFVKGADGKCGTSTLIGSSTVNTSNTSPTPGPPPGPPWKSSLNTVKGINTKAAVFDDKYEPIYTPTEEACLDIIKGRGGDAFVYKNLSRGECYGLRNMPLANYQPLSNPMEAQESFVSGCTNQNNAWPACGTTTTWCHRTYNQQDLPYESDLSLIPPGEYELALYKGPYQFQNFNDIKRAWEVDILQGETQTLKNQGYNYAAIAMSQSSFDVAWGKSIPNQNEDPDVSECSYTRDTQYTVGRRPTVKNSEDTFTGTTWKIYDMTQIS